MSKYDTPDTQIDGQLTITQMMEPPERIVGVARAFADVWKQLTLAEQKTFSYALTYFDFSKPTTNDCVNLDKKVLAKILDMESDIDHLSVNLFKAIKTIALHSHAEIKEKNLEFDGYIVSSTLRVGNMIQMQFNPQALKLFSNLIKSEIPFITMWSSDIYEMKSKRSAVFYEELRQRTDTRREVNETLLGIRALKRMFDIPETGKGSYMRSKGGFNRAEFEKKVIDPICDDLKKSRMIQLICQQDGKPYEKVKNGRQVDGYRFYWTFTSHPAIATANEVQQIQERVDDNPEILKIAKDILHGERKMRQKTEDKNKFNNFQQREYDFQELERRLLQRPIGNQEGEQ